MEAVGRHLVAMDVPVVAAAAKEGEGEAGGEEGAPAAGRPLDHRLAALRLRFFYVAEAVQELVNTKRGATEGVLVRVAPKPHSGTPDYLHCTVSWD